MVFQMKLRAHGDGRGVGKNDDTMGAAKFTRDSLFLTRHPLSPSLAIVYSESLFSCRGTVVFWSMHEFLSVHLKIVQSRSVFILYIYICVYVGRNMLFAGMCNTVRLRLSLYQNFHAPPYISNVLYT